MPNNNTFQIIGGAHRGRKFHFPDANGLRPTPNKVRETLFNWIQFEAQHKTYLDLFAGSGALGFEALSRGAKHIVSIEKNRNAWKVLEKNRQLLKTDKMHCLHQDALDFLAKPNHQPFDFVFLDPPFHQNILPNVLKWLLKGGFVALGSQIYIESEFAITPDFLAENHSTQTPERPLSKKKTSPLLKIKQKNQSGAVHYCLIEVL